MEVGLAARSGEQPPLRKVLQSSLTQATEIVTLPNLLSRHQATTFCNYVQGRSEQGAAQDVIAEPVGGIALGVFEEVAVYLKRDGRIGVSQSMLYLGDRRAGGDHRRRTAVAESVKGHSPEASSRQGGVEGYQQHPISAHR